MKIILVVLDVIIKNMKIRGGKDVLMNFSCKGGPKWYLSLDLCKVSLFQS